MKNVKISSLQMAMLMYPTIVATAILSVPSTTAAYAKQDLWLSPILASGIGFLTVYIAVRLHDLYPGKTIIQISEEITGRVLGKLIGLLFILFYLQATGEIIRSYAEFIVSSFLIQTPIIVVMTSMISLCAFAVYTGLEVLGRMTQLLFPLFFLPLLLMIFFLMPEYELGNVLPVLEFGIVPPIKGAVIPSGWFTEFFLIIFLLPFLTDHKKGMKHGLLTVLAVMLTLVIVNLSVLFVLGNSTSTKAYPLMNVSRYINFAEFFENLESITMAIWILGAFIKISVFYHAVVIATAKWLKIEDNRPIVWPIGILIIEFSYWALPNIFTFNRYDSMSFPFYGAFVQTIIPTLLLVIAIIKQKHKVISFTSK